MSGWVGRALRQVFEELHVRRDPERDARIVGPLDDWAIIDGGVVEAAGRKGHLVVSIRLQHGLPHRDCFVAALLGTTANCGVIASEAKQSRCGGTVSLRRLGLEPIDDRAASGFPDTLAGADVTQHLVEMPDAPGLAHDPGMQVQDH